MTNAFRYYFDIMILRHIEVMLQQYTVILTVFDDNSSFVWPENVSFARSRRLKATDPFEGQTKLLLSEEPVYNCFAVHLHFLKNFLFTLSMHSHIHILVRKVRECGRHLDIVTSIYHVTYWTNKNKAIGQQFDSGQ